jgi:hypothetical protein
LIKASETFHSESALRAGEAKEVNDSVSGLINLSLQNYYFEQSAM